MIDQKQVDTAYSLLNNTEIQFTQIHETDIFVIVGYTAQLEVLKAEEVIRLVDFDPAVSTFKVIWDEGYGIQSSQTEIKSFDYFTTDIGFTDQMIDDIANLEAGETLLLGGPTDKVRVVCVNRADDIKRSS